MNVYNIVSCPWVNMVNKTKLVFLCNFPTSKSFKSHNLICHKRKILTQHSNRGNIKDPRTKKLTQTNMCKGTCTCFSPNCSCEVRNLSLASSQYSRKLPKDILELPHRDHKQTVWWIYSVWCELWFYPSAAQAFLNATSLF